MPNQILFGRLGNKEKDIKYFKNHLPLDVSKVIEPFGGTFAISRIIYKDDKYSKFVNDNDENLFEIYKNPDKYSEFKKKMNNIAIKHLNIKKNVIYDKFIEEVKKDDTIDINSNFFKIWHSEKVVRGRNVKTSKEINNDEHINIMKKINFSCVDYMEIINKFKNDKNAFIFIDPPYMFSDNTQYSQQQRKSGEDMTDIIVNILEIFKDKKNKAKIMLVINDLKILRWLFNGYIKADYDKIYQIGKRRDKILVICNY
jgi:site-specific DNA-adenine methylase